MIRKGKKIIQLFGNDKKNPIPSEIEIKIEYL